MKERDGKVIVDMFVHQEHDCMAGPTKRVTNVYDYLNPDPDLIPYAHAWTLQRRSRFGAFSHTPP